MLTGPISKEGVSWWERVMFRGLAGIFELVTSTSFDNEWGIDPRYRLDVRKVFIKLNAVLPYPTIS
jgi:hypothetical protein